MEARICFEF